MNATLDPTNPSDPIRPSTPPAALADMGLLSEPIPGHDEERLADQLTPAKRPSRWSTVATRGLAVAVIFAVGVVGGVVLDQQLGGGTDAPGGITGPGGSPDGFPGGGTPPTGGPGDGTTSGAPGTAPGGSSGTGTDGSTGTTQQPGGPAST